MLPISSICHTLIVIRGHPFALCSFSMSWSWKHSKITCVSMTDCSHWSKYLPNGGIQELLVKPWTSSIGWYAVTYRRIAMAIKTASKVGAFLHPCFFCCCPGGRWGNTEQVVAQCWYPVASDIALDMLHWVMHFTSHRRTAMAIKTAGGWGTFAHCRLIFPWHYL